MIEMTKEQAQALLNAIPLMRPSEISIELLEAIAQLKKFAERKYKYHIIGRNVHVIRQIQRMTGWGLKQAKDFYDSNRKIEDPETDVYKVTLILDTENQSDYYGAEVTLLD
ncbi:MAG TPA: hypothetical protein VFM18_23705 [Methanosarcina sp.]|nr:hypothetical protein [Methanosarcina sp.]